MGAGDTLGPVIDLRSDTVTRPGEAMRRAMAEAEVGDDWFGDDPSVNRLQERAAELLGKEAALFVASGTMANQIALRMLVRPGHEFVAEARAHVVVTESNAVARTSGAVARPVHAANGVLAPDQVAEAIAPDPYGVRVVDLVALEDTHQVGGGRVQPIEMLRGIRKVAKDAGLRLYLDGARLFNASVASGVDAAKIAAEADLLMIALSKGLGAPVGSLLCGPADLIAEARRVRMQFGGGWRQAGILAAAGLLALEEGPKRLHEDHERARLLAAGVAEAFPGAVDPSDVETNIVFVDPEAVGISLEEILERLAGDGVLITRVAGRARMLTHLDVSRADIDVAIEAWRRLRD